MACYNSRVIAAPVDEVWKTLRNFHEMSWAKGVINELAPIGARAGDQIGAKRVLNGAFQETLQAIDDLEHEIRYTIDDGPDVLSKSNVSRYVGRIRAFPVTDKNETFVEWSSSWQDGRGVREFCDPIYVALLDALEKHFS